MKREANTLTGKFVKKRRGELGRCQTSEKREEPKPIIVQFKEVALSKMILKQIQQYSFTLVERGMIPRNRIFCPHHFVVYTDSWTYPTMEQISQKSPWPIS